MSAAVKTIESDPQYEVLLRAAALFEEHAALKRQMREAEDRLSAACREYGNAYRIWGVRPEHLRQACVARGLLT